MIPNTYNPEKGRAYYFTEHGCQVRKLPKYDIKGSSNYDDPPQDPDGRCSKMYPKVSYGGFGYVLLWFCPIHGHCFGFHLISGGEGRKDPFHSLLKFLPNPPDEIFYDFACGLNEYSLNREPHFFFKTRFWHDFFHGFSHKCPICYRYHRVTGLEIINSEICEQFNAFIQSIKYTGSHLSQSHFCFYMQFFIWIWNEKKTKGFADIVNQTISGCQ